MTHNFNLSLHILQMCRFVVQFTWASPYSSLSLPVFLEHCQSAIPICPVCLALVCCSFETFVTGTELLVIMSDLFEKIPGSLKLFAFQSLFIESRSFCFLSCSLFEAPLFKHCRFLLSPSSKLFLVTLGICAYSPAFRNTFITYSLIVLIAHTQAVYVTKILFCLPDLTTQEALCHETSAHPVYFGVLLWSIELERRMLRLYNVGRFRKANWRKG